MSRIESEELSMMDIELSTERERLLYFAVLESQMYRNLYVQTKSDRNA